MTLVKMMAAVVEQSVENLRSVVVMEVEEVEAAEVHYLEC